jgi:hypothetical protein
MLNNFKLYDIMIKKLPSTHAVSEDAALVISFFCPGRYSAFVSCVRSRHQCGESAHKGLVAFIIA